MEKASAVQRAIFFFLYAISSKFTRTPIVGTRWESNEAAESSFLPIRATGPPIVLTERCIDSCPSRHRNVCVCGKKHARVGGSTTKKHGGEAFIEWTLSPHAIAAVQTRTDFGKHFSSTKRWRQHPELDG